MFLLFYSLVVSVCICAPFLLSRMQFKRTNKMPTQFFFVIFCYFFSSLESVDVCVCVCADDWEIISQFTCKIIIRTWVNAIYKIPHQQTSNRLYGNIRKLWAKFKKLNGNSSNVSIFFKWSQFYTFLYNYTKTLSPSIYLSHHTRSRQHSFREFLLLPHTKKKIHKLIA